MKKFFLLSLFLAMSLGVTFADDAKVLPAHVFRVRAVPVVVNTDQYFRSNGNLGPYIWEDLPYSTLSQAYSNFFGNLKNNNIKLRNFTDFSTYIGDLSANQAIQEWNDTYDFRINDTTSIIIPAFQADSIPIIPTNTPWGMIKNKAVLDATGSVIFAIEYGVTDRLSIGSIIPYKHLKITHNWSWIDNEEYNDEIDAMIRDYAPTLGALQAAIQNFPAGGSPDSLAAMQELYNSVAWMMVSGHDPFGNGIPAALFPFYQGQNPQDTSGFADIYELANFYYPTMEAQGFGDIEIGLKYRLAGQGLTDKNKRYAIAIKTGFRLPTGKIVGAYDPKNPTAQFSQIDLGGGQLDYEFHLAADYYSKIGGRPWEVTGEIYYNYQFEGTYNTQLDLLKFVDLDPATTVARLGKTYKMKPGNEIAWAATTSLDLITNRLSIGFDYEGFTKGRDKYSVPNAPMESLDQVVTYVTSTGDTATLKVDANNNGKFDALEWAAWKEVHGEGDKLTDTKSYGHKIMFSMTFKDFSMKIIPMPYEMYAKYHIPLAGMSNWAPKVWEFGIKAYLKFW